MVTQLAPTKGPEACGLHPGPYWRSLDQFRRVPPAELSKLLPCGVYGEFETKNDRYIVMNRETFNTLAGLASELHRLQNGLMLVQQAVQLVVRFKGDRMTLNHLESLLFQFPGLQTDEMVSGHALEFDDDERVEEPGREGEGLSPFVVHRPVFGRGE